jgi:hypothetical protein
MLLSSAHHRRIAARPSSHVPINRVTAVRDGAAHRILGTCLFCLAIRVLMKGPRTVGGGTRGTSTPNNGRVLRALHPLGGSTRPAGGEKKPWPGGKLRGRCSNAAPRKTDQSDDWGPLLSSRGASPGSAGGAPAGATRVRPDPHRPAAVMQSRLSTLNKVRDSWARPTVQSAA